MKFDLGSFFKTLEGFAPLIMQMAGVPAALIPIVVKGIGIAEQLRLPGVDKKAAVIDIVGTAVGGINAVKPGTVIDWTGPVSQGIDATISAINAVHDQINLVKPPAAPPAASAPAKS